MVVYKGDAAIYDSRDGGSPEPRDVQVVVQEHPDVGWHTQSGYDYYVRWDNRWVGVDLFGLYDYLLETGLVLFGRTTTRVEFDEAMRKALAIRAVEREKTGWLSNERRPTDN
jgi:hypothetical protein